MTYSSTKKGACFTLKGHFYLEKGHFSLRKKGTFWVLGPPPPPGSAALAGDRSRQFALCLEASLFFELLQTY